MSVTTKSPYDIVIRPIITEKTMRDTADRKYTFEVARTANKYEIAAAIEALQREVTNAIQVTEVNTLVVKGKSRRGRFMRRGNVGRTSDWKKAIVTLAPGQAIEMVEGV